MAISLDPHATLHNLRQLGPNWTSYGALRPKADPLDYVQTALDSLSKQPVVGLSPDGHATMVWDDMEFEIHPDGNVFGTVAAGPT